MKSVSQAGSEEQEQDRRVGLAEIAAKRSRQKAGIAHCCSCSTVSSCGTSWRFTCRRRRCAGPARQEWQERSVLARLPCISAHAAAATAELLLPPQSWIRPAHVQVQVRHPRVALACRMRPPPGTGWGPLNWPSCASARQEG